MKRTSFFIGFFALVFQSLNASATAPHFEWEILYTPHFEVIYHKPQKELAKHYAFAAEESYRQLSAVFSDLPETTVLVLDDSTDLTNGSATFLPYNWINIYPALPAEGDSLDHYGYWPTAIMIHEMTHIANFQPVNGVFTPLSWLFGRVIAPNILLPRWYLEGLAVDVESRYTSHGRLRSPRTQGILRALAEENAFDEFSIDRINEVRIPTWPFGERPYFFGSLLQKSLVDQGPDDMRERWNQRYGRRMPFFINAVPQDEFGKGFVHLLGDVYAELKTKAKSQVESIQSEGSSDRTAFKEVDHEQHSPVIDSSGTQLIYISKSDQRSGIYRIQKTKAAPDFSKNDPELLFYAGYPQRLVWNNQGTGFYFDELNLDTPFVAYRQILYFDLNTMEKHLVSPENLRLQDPALNPSGDQLVAILTKENGRQVLAALSLKDHSVKELYQAPLEERLSSPNYLNSEQIVFVKKNLRGEEQILVSSFKDLKVSKLPQSFFDLYSVRAYGNALSFVSSKNGVPNIYLLSLKDPSASPKALTNTTSLVHSFAPSNEKTWVTSEMTSKGRKLFLRPLRSLKDPALKSQPPVVAYKDSPKEKIPTQKELDEVVQDEGSFYPFKYLLPRYWIPFVYPVEGGVLMQGSTSGTDPVQVNQYVLNGSYDTATNGSSYGIAYLNNSFPVSIGLSASKFQEYLGASSATIEKTSYSGELLYPLGFLSKRWNASLGYNRTSAERSTGSLHREGPGAALSFSNLLDKRYSQNGSLLALSFDKYLSGPSRLEYERTRFSLGQKVSYGLPEDHSAWLGLKGSFSNQLPRSQILDYGDRSLGANYLVNLTESSFLYRGYPSGTLLGRQLLNGNLEYRFPIKDIQRGDRTKAYFLKTLNGVLFADAMAVDGYYFDRLDENTSIYRQTSLTEIHPSAGGELRLDTTLAYHLPITFIMGGYYGLSRQMGENFSFFLGIGGQDPLSETSHRRSH